MGLVYEFDPTIHTCDPFVIPKEWTRYRVIDFGFTNPFVCQWWAESPDNVFYMYKELYHSHRIVSDHAKQIRDHSKAERYIMTIADHDAEDRATLEAVGIHTRAARKNVSTGIQEVQKRLLVRENGTPGIILFRNALIEQDRTLVEAKKPTCTREEFDSYSWPKAGDGKMVKEAPIKIDDHGLDCLKYLCAEFTRPKQGNAKYYFGSGSIQDYARNRMR